jgi:hypothetical protein
LPPTGWFAAAEAELVVPHVKNRLVDSVTIDSRRSGLLHLPSAELDWTVAPRFDVGYRLPSGFGEFLVSYRFLETSGSQGVLSVDGPATLRSRLDLNMADFDYASREFSLWPLWDMKWRFGGRFAEIFFDSKLNEPFAEAAAGSEVFESRVTNHFEGFGPHWGLELARKLEDSGFSLFSRADGAILLGRVRQGFFETSTIAGPDGTLLSGVTRESNPQAVPMLNVQAGLRWQPPDYSALRLFLGYEYEYWWNVGRLSTTRSRAELADQGILFEAEFRF